MRWPLKVKDYVEHVEHGWRGEVSEVSLKWDWVEVLWENGKYIRYSQSNRSIRKTKSPQEERADKILREENLGITDHWREYDD